jgi:hypothetical protein
MHEKKRKPDMLHDMLVHESGLGRLQGTENGTLTPQDQQRVPKPKYEAAVLQAHLRIRLCFEKL